MGQQQGVEHLAEAAYNGSLNQFLRGWFSRSQRGIVPVSTEGESAVPGDLAISIFVMDNNSNPNIQTQLPSGWTLLGKNDAAVDNAAERIGGGSQCLVESDSVLRTLVGCNVR